MVVPESQLELVMIVLGLSMAVFEGQPKVVITQFEIMMKTNWMTVGMAEGVVD